MVLCGASLRSIAIAPFISNVICHDLLGITSILNIFGSKHAVSECSLSFAGWGFFIICSSASCAAFCTSKGAFLKSLEKVVLKSRDAITMLATTLFGDGSYQFFGRLEGAFV